MYRVALIAGSRSFKGLSPPFVLFGFLLLICILIYLFHAMKINKTFDWLIDWSSTDIMLIVALNWRTTHKEVAELSDDRSLQTLFKQQWFSSLHGVVSEYPLLSYAAVYSVLSLSIMAVSTVNGGKNTRVE